MESPQPRRPRFSPNPQQPLLLAPAGTFEAAALAMEAGADAVYVGLRGWSRGGSRSEVEGEQVLRCVRLAHSLHKQVHLAVNTIAAAQQQSRLLQVLEEMLVGGVDAVILNDIGLLRSVRQRLPDLPITVSVGCGALNADDILLYQDLGAAAVVLPGYLEPAEIAAIKARVAVRIEVMVHMVEEFIQLGKCWMPSYLNFAATRSSQPIARLTGSVKRGGVGSCFRICQQPWSVMKEGEEVDSRLFPSRQISRVSDLGAFLDAGADVIKIQGRSLPLQTLGSIVALYRDVINARPFGQALPCEPATLPAMWTVQGR